MSFEIVLSKLLRFFKMPMHFDRYLLPLTYSQINEHLTLLHPLDLLARRDSQRYVA